MKKCYHLCANKNIIIKITKYEKDFITSMQENPLIFS